MRFLGLICTFAASITIGNCLLCTECYNNTTPNCEGSIATCASCLTIITEEGHGNGSVSMIEKSCNLYPEVCNISYSVTADNFHLGFVSSCCDTDLCNHDTIVAPTKNTTENGVVCPSCVLQNGTECVTNQTMRCVGDETRCISFSGKLFDQGSCKNLTLQGCVTENVCKAKHLPLYPKTQLCEFQNLMCSEGSSTTSNKC
ncbi:Hypothetical predicted protein [Pelobates cultripes]|uniref:Sodefrin-like factor n=1 Tax=Pelobates cultripes TaxID=61616 RepID=A0AAD1T3W6_PELCU|nr:Hypothetical predicted protein [Pelobates cultripes]